MSFFHKYFLKVSFLIYIFKLGGACAPTRSLVNPLILLAHRFFFDGKITDRSVDLSIHERSRMVQFIVWTDYTSFSFLSRLDFERSLGYLFRDSETRFFVTAYTRKVAGKNSWSIQQTSIKVEEYKHLAKVHC